LNLPGDFTDLTTVCGAGLLHFKLGAHLLDLRGLRLSGQAADLGHQRGIGHSQLDARREHAEFVTQQATRVADVELTPRDLISESAHACP